MEDSHEPLLFGFLPKRASKSLVEKKKFSASQNTQFKFNSENNYLELLVLPVMRSELSQIHVEIYGFTYILIFSCPQKGTVVMQLSKKN